MASAISQAVNTISRSFSRQGVTMMRVVPEEVVQAGEDLIFKSAVVAALLGVSFSMFGISQLQDDSRRRRIGTLNAKTTHKAGE